MYTVKTKNMTNFNFIQDSSDRVMYQTAYDAITQLELWDFVTNFNEENGFMFSSSPNIGRIISKIEQLGYGEHSGASFGCTMRVMQTIGKYGMEHYMNSYSLR